jgi:hypothetical protein
MSPSSSRAAGKSPGSSRTVKVSRAKTANALQYDDTEAPP